MDNTVNEGGDKSQGSQSDTGYGTHDGRGNVKTDSREQKGTGFDTNTGLDLHDSLTAKSIDTAGPTVPANAAGYISTDTGVQPAQAESWRSHSK